MSWFAKNYEKAALGGAVAVALGLTYMGWSKFGSAEGDFVSPLKGSGNSNAAVRDADLIAKAKASMNIDRSWTQATTAEGRPIDLFTGIPLFVSSADPEKPIDVLDPGTPPVHAPIPNSWWTENRLDPGFGDSPDRDPDADGFSNLEEYTAKTNPNDAKDVPSLIAKLMYVRDESLAWVIKPSFGSDGKFPFTYEDSKRGANRTGAANMIAPGELFFPAGVMQDRFKLLGHEVRKVVNPRTKAETDVTMVRIEDQRPNKKGLIYEFPSPLKEEVKSDFVKYDRTAVLSLQALGLNGKEFKVEENMTFSLPPDAPKKNYRLKEVTPASITIEDVDGKAKPVVITKGSMPTIAE